MTSTNFCTTYNLNTKSDSRHCSRSNKVFSCSSRDTKTLLHAWRWEKSKKSAPNWQAQSRSYRSRRQLIESFGEFRPRGPKNCKSKRGSERQGNYPIYTPQTIKTTPSTPHKPSTPQKQFVKRDTKKRTHRGLAKDEELLVLGGMAYACRKIPLPSNKSTFCAVYGSSDGIWSARFWVGPLESLGVKDKKRVSDDEKTSLLERQKQMCQECSCPVSIGSYSNADIDHVIPRHLGGKTVLDNLQIICVPCHRLKTGLESKGVRKVFPDLDLDPSDCRMYAVSNDGTLDLKGGSVNPLKYMREPVGMVAMS